jgi:hypothetical protein
MQSNTQVLHQFFVDSDLESAKANSAVDAQLNQAAVIRSENNILLWMAYLPEDCIRTMVLMGWDTST